MTNNTKHFIAGEPADNLLEGLRKFDVTRMDSGAVSGHFELEGEIGASWLRAIERYGADLVTPDQFVGVEQRHADALIQIVTELTEFMDRQDAQVESS